MEKVKKLLIAMNNLNIGGIERTGVSLLSFLNPEYFDVTLVLNDITGAYLNKVPSWVKVIEMPFSREKRYEYKNGTKATLIAALSKGNFKWFFRVAFSGLRKIFTFPPLRGAFYWEYLYKGMEGLKDMYDCVIAYHGIEQLVFVTRVVKAKKRIAWVHLEPEKSGFSPYVLREYYRDVDKVYCVSLTCVEQFKKLLPDSLPKLDVFYSFIDVEQIKKNALESTGFTDNFAGKRILSVGRLARQKGFDIALSVCLKLKREGFCFKWYVIGSGEEADLLKNMILKMGLQDEFVLLGEINNPYPFFRTCDIYVQPSRYEGFCLSLAEAKIFNKPIVCTDFAGAREQVRHEETGLICACRKSAIYSAVRELLDNPDMCLRFNNNLRKEPIQAFDGIQKLHNLIDSC